MVEVTKAPKKLNELYNSEEFLERLDELYDIYGKYSIVAKRLGEEFKCAIDRNQVANLYKKNFAIKMTGDNEKEFFDKSFKRMQKRYEDAWEMIGDLIMQYKKFRKTLADKDDLTQALTFMKMSSQIIAMTSEIRKQLEFIGKKQEEIKVFQQNNLIISPVQINQQIKKIFTGMKKEEIQEFFKSLEDNRFAELAKELDLPNGGK